MARHRTESKPPSDTSIGGRDSSRRPRARGPGGAGEVAVVPIDTLRPHPRNPRRGDIEAIKASLAQHDQYRAIVVNKPTQEVLAGNHVLRAARALGWSQICV